MLIIEGPDGVGKTTLAHAIVKRFNDMDEKPWPLIYQHFSRLPDGWDYFGDYLPFMRPNVVMDRFIMSELVYGTVTRGETMISPRQYRMLDGHLAVQASMTVVISALPSAYERMIDSDMKARDQMFSRDINVRVNEAYCEIIGSGSYRRHSPQLDHTFMMNGSWPAEDPSLIGRIVAEYRERCCSLALTRRPRVSPTT